MDKNDNREGSTRQLKKAYKYFGYHLFLYYVCKYCLITNQYK